MYVFDLLMGHAQVGLSQRRFYLFNDFYIRSGLLFLLLSKKVDLVSKHPAAQPRQFVDGSSRELMMEELKCWILSIT